MSNVQSFEALVENMTEEVWQRMRQSVELGRWPDGRQLTAEQRELSLEAIIAWEIRNNIPLEERTGYLPQSCKNQGPSPVAQAAVIANAKELKV